MGAVLKVFGGVADCGPRHNKGKPGCGWRPRIELDVVVKGCKDESIGLWRGRWLNTRGVKREKKVFRMERSKRRG